jgi:hypothetical protein
MSGFRIKTIHAFIATEADDTEGVVGFRTETGAFWPMVCADEARVDSLRKMAQLVAQQTGVKIVLAKFSVRQDVEEIKP